MKPFAELGALVEGRWRDKNYDEHLFPEIAAQALSEAEITSRLDPWDIIRWVHTTPDLPRQMDRAGKFGNPPITLFVGPRFYVDVYFWLDGTTAIHQHSFSGAFQVLLGSSVHSRFVFEKDLEINPYLLIGKLKLQKVSLLTKGNIKQIRPGHDFIHSLFHLDRPSATITVRSNYAPHAATQYSYLKPFIAFDPFYEEDSLEKKVRTVSLLLSMKHPEADQFIHDLLDNSDFQTSFSVLNAAFHFLGSNELEELFQLSISADRFQTMLDHVRHKHGDVVDLLSPVFEEQRRENDIIKRRGLIEGEDHRFLLALLLNVPDRRMVLELIKQKYPDSDPVDLALGWVKELAKIRIFGSHEPNVIAIRDFSESYLFVLKGLLEGLSDEEINAQAEKANYIQPDGSVKDIASQIRNSPLFKRIFFQQTADLTCEQASAS